MTDAQILALRLARLGAALLERAFELDQIADMASVAGRNANELRRAAANAASAARAALGAAVGGVPPESGP